MLSKISSKRQQDSHCPQHGRVVYFFQASEVLYATAIAASASIVKVYRAGAVDYIANLAQNPPSQQLNVLQNIVAVYSRVSLLA